MSIVHVRIDERLIHGQVVTQWVNALRVMRIMVINDEAANDELQKTSLKMATPAGIRLSVLTIEKAATNIDNGKYGKSKPPV